MKALELLKTPAIATLMALGLLLGACGDDKPAETCKEAVCEDGAGKCIGNASAKCVSGTWKLNACGFNSRCVTDQTSAGTSCDKRECNYPGNVVCGDDKTPKSCLDDGANETEQTQCGAEKVCAGGACVDVACTAGEKSCGWREVITCRDTGSGYDKTKCADNEVCKDGACATETCSPGTTKCSDDGKELLTCSEQADRWVNSACPTGETCYAEFGGCGAELCTDADTDGGGTDEGGTADDTTAGDTEGGSGETTTTGDDEGGTTTGGTGLEPLDTAEVTIDGTTIKFKSSQTAFYVESESNLVIAMNEGKLKMEVSLMPIEELSFPVLSSEVAGDTNVNIRYHDGSELIGMAQFRYESVDYLVEIQKFETKGGRVVGTFSGTLTDGTALLQMTNGKFDVKRHD